MNYAAFGSPLKLHAWVCVIYAVGLVLLPASPVHHVSSDAVVFTFYCVLASFAGLWVAEHLRFRRTHRRDVRRNEKTINWKLIVPGITGLATVGALLLLLDRFVISGVQIGSEFSEVREAMAGSEAGLLSTLTAFFSSFAFVGVPLILLARAMGAKVLRLYDLAGWTNIAVVLALSVMAGSRSAVIVYVVLHIFTVITLRRMSRRQGRQGRRKQGTFRSFLIMGVLGIVAMIALVELFRMRLDQMGLDPMVSIVDSGYAYTLYPKDEFLQILYGNEFLSVYGAVIYSVVAYVYHGIYEFLLLHDSFYGDPQMGRFTFWLPLKFLGIIFQKDMGIDVTRFGGYRFGVFSTVLGPIFADFRFLTPAAVFVIYLGLAWPARLVRNGNVEWYLLGTVCKVVIVFGPMVSLLSLAMGAYLIVVTIIIALIFRSFAQGNKNKAYENV